MLLKTKPETGECVRNSIPFFRLYGEGPASCQRADETVGGLRSHFGAGAFRLFSAPGRTELCGNHTDHNRGLGLAAAVDADILAAARPTDRPVIRLHSQGYYTDIIDLACLHPREKEANHSASLIRGVAAGFFCRGLAIGGFDAYTTSRVPRGAGVSSSAAFEVLVAGILNGLYNGGRVDPVTIAQIAQEAENRFFGKPCGLMDQAACSVGGCVRLDMQEPETPSLRRMSADFDGWGLSLCLVNTGGSHTDLTQEYAACRLEMQEVAKLLGGEVLREIPREQFEEALPFLRRKAGDRAVLRALHFYEENGRVDEQCRALEEGDRESFLRLTRESGHSSQTLLQNVSVPGTPREQGVALGLALSEAILGGEGAWRVHGGGFAGTIQAFVPKERLAAYRERMEQVFGPGNCHVLTLRQAGGVEVMGE